MKNGIHKLAAFALALAVLLLLGVPAIADGETGSVTVTPPSGASLGELTLYRVADVVGGAYVLTEDFAASEADLTSLDDAAASLASYAAANALAGMAGTTNADGAIVFDALPRGLYLVAQASAPSGWVMDAFLVSVPVTADDGAETWAVDASPKTEIYATADITVTKVWNDGGDVSSRPASVTVRLYRDGEQLDIVTLDESNAWTYTWTDMPQSDAYSVAEDAVTGYAAAYSQDGYAFTVTNSPKLVQTGQLNWPVPVLAVCGLLLFAAGWALVNLKKRDG